MHISSSSPEIHSWLVSSARVLHSDNVSGVLVLSTGYIIGFFGALMLSYWLTLLTKLTLAVLLVNWCYTMDTPLTHWLAKPLDDKYEHISYAHALAITLENLTDALATPLVLWC